jgi:Mg2+/Co2+ transporter CorB
MARTKSRWACVVEGGKYKGIVTLESLIEAYEREVRELNEVK